jgi:hypothetical protein
MEQSYRCLHFIISGSKLIGRRKARVDLLASVQGYRLADNDHTC